MKRLSFRTLAVGMLVVGASSVAGVGLGRLITKVALAEDVPKAKTVFIRSGGAPKVARSEKEGIRIIYPNPQHVFSRPRGRDHHNELASAVVPIPQWSYSMTASDAMGGQTFSGSIMGRSPFDATKGTTTVRTQIVPLVITIADAISATPSTVTYDPTANDPCVPGHTGVEMITGSPLFTNNPWTMNGVAVGNTQYMDAFMRAQFWSLVGGTPYHFLLKPEVLPAQTLTFSGSGSSGPGQNYDAASLIGTRGCGSVGVVTMQDLDAAVQALINGPLAGTINAGTLPIFLTKNVVSADSGTNIRVNCCALGFHGSFAAGANLQVYSPFSLDTSGIFGNDISTLSHELGEAINDPTGNNPTPMWGGLGQVRRCQDNLEVGDPLSPGFHTPTNEFQVVGANGLTYHLQELAFANWFFDAPSLGAGGKSSNNGSFNGGAKPCPPGGTN